MKVIIKGGEKKKNQEIEDFFMDKIFPVLNFGIAIEMPANSDIKVYETKDDQVKEYIDPTAEVIVELPWEKINLAMDLRVSLTGLKSGNYYDEALAIRTIEKAKPPFSIEYYSCRYTPAFESQPNLKDSKKEDKPGTTVVELRPLENFDDCAASLLQYFECSKNDSRGVWLSSIDGKSSFRVQMLSLTATDEFEMIEGENGQLKFSAQLLEHHPEGFVLAGTLFTKCPIIKGYLTTKYGSRKTYFESDQKLFLRNK